MPIKNNCSEGSPDIKGGDENSKQKKPGINQRFRAYFLLMVFCISFMWMAVAPVAAEDNGTVSDSLSSLTPMIEDIAGIMPAVAILIVSVIGIVILLVGYKFVIGILSAILDAIRGAFNFKL